MNIYFSSLIISLALSVLSLAQEGESTSSEALESLKTTAQAFVEAEDRGDWNQCYALLAKPIRQACTLEAFTQRMQLAVPQKKFSKPHIPMAYVNRSGGMLGRVIIVETAPQTPKSIKVVAFEAMNNDEGWRILSVTGSAATSLIDDVFFSRRLLSPR